MIRLDEDFDTVNAVAVGALGVLHFRAGRAGCGSYMSDSLTGSARGGLRKAMSELSRELLQLQQASKGQTLNVALRGSIPAFTHGTRLQARELTTYACWYEDLHAAVGRGSLWCCSW